LQKLFGKYVGCQIAKVLVTGPCSDKAETKKENLTSTVGKILIVATVTCSQWRTLLFGKMNEGSCRLLFWHCYIEQI